MSYTFSELVETISIYFQRNGVPSPAADDTAWVLTTAEALGLKTHGAVRALEYVRRIELGGMDPVNPEVVGSTGSVSLVDARNGLGPAATMVATRHVRDAAAESGIAMAFVRHSNHFGPAMPYSILLAEAGIASYVASNASSTMAAWGGTTPVIGNSPFGWGLPAGSGGRPIFVDMALSQVARAKIRQAQLENRPLPESWATDVKGQPTSDPAEALKGLLQPMGGHKGFGLSVAVDFFAGVLSGSAYSDTVRSWSADPGAESDLGHFVIGVNLDAVRRFTPDLDERISDFQRRLLADGDTADVRLPGQREYDSYARSRESHSIKVDEEVVSELTSVATA
ncbi:Ldh family oxidoreductase [Nocardiopsis nanhaiensis]